MGQRQDSKQPFNSEYVLKGQTPAVDAPAPCTSQVPQLIRDRYGSMKEVPDNQARAIQLKKNQQESTSAKILVLKPDPFSFLPA